MGNNQCWAVLIGTSITSGYQVPIITIYPLLLLFHHIDNVPTNLIMLYVPW
jgi:hypothetical protein